MRRNILFFLLVCAALIIGFVIGQNVKPIQRLKIVKEKIVDTVFKTQTIKVPFETETITYDTVFVNLSDSATVINNLVKVDSLPIVINTNFEDSLQIKKDEKLSEETLTIEIIKAQEVDTLLQKLLDVQSIKQKQIIVEYWESPINYTGYKLSKTKLIVYGINPLKRSEIYKNDDKYYLEVDNLFYELEETASFKSLLSLPKPEFIYD